MAGGPHQPILRRPSTVFLGISITLVFAITLASCANRPTSSASGNAAPPQLHLVSAAVSATPLAAISVVNTRASHIVLPNPALVGCKSASCYQVAGRILRRKRYYPWQVSLDFNQPAIIGLTAFYDQPTSSDDVKAAIDERYGKWAVPHFTAGPVLIWRVEPPTGFVIQLSTSDKGMVQVIYLMFDAKHPTSDHVAAQFLRACEERANGSDFGCELARSALKR